MSESEKPSTVPVAQALQRHSGGWKAVPPANRSSVDKPPDKEPAKSEARRPA
jgi:hypothetical protein